MAVMGSLDVTKPLPGYKDIKSAIEHMPDCNIRDALLSQLAKANGDIDVLRNSIANYFDASMDRISGIYKRYLKWISIGVGFLIVLALNADSIKVGTSLWTDASLRAQMMQGAQELLKKDPNSATASAGAAPVACTKDPKSGDKPADTPTQLKCLDNMLRRLPIGWPDEGYIKQDFKSWTDPIFSGWIFVKFFGLFISALAVSLGAFDMLSKFMNIRGTGIKPQSTTSKSTP